MHRPASPSTPSNPSTASNKSPPPSPPRGRPRRPRRPSDVEKEAQNWAHRNGHDWHDNNTISVGGTTSGNDNTTAPAGDIFISPTFVPTPQAMVSLIPQMHPEAVLGLQTTQTALNPQATAFQSRRFTQQSTLNPQAIPFQPSTTVATTTQASANLNLASTAANTTGPHINQAMPSVTTSTTQATGTAPQNLTSGHPTINWQIPAGYTGGGTSVQDVYNNRYRSIFFEEGLRYQPGPASQDVYRTAMIQGIPNDAPLRSITAAITTRGTIVRIDHAVLPANLARLGIEGGSVARIVFLYETEALEFEAAARRNGLVIHGQPVNVSLVGTPTYPANDETNALIQGGATRVLAVDGGRTREEVERALVGVGGVVDVVEEGAGGVVSRVLVETTGVVRATTIRAMLMFQGLVNVGYGLDPCCRF